MPQTVTRFIGRQCSSRPQNEKFMVDIVISVVRTSSFPRRTFIGRVFTSSLVGTSSVLFSVRERLAVISGLTPWAIIWASSLFVTVYISSYSSTLLLERANRLVASFRPTSITLENFNR